MDLSPSPTVALSLTVKDALTAFDFYTKGFGAKEEFKISAANGDLLHAELTLGNTRIYLSDETAEKHNFDMLEVCFSFRLFAIITKNCNKSYEQALAGGAKALKPPKDQFWGMRTALVADIYGHTWIFKELLEEVSAEEIAKREKEIFGRSFNE